MLPICPMLSLLYFSDPLSERQPKAPMQPSIKLPVIQATRRSRDATLPG
jgi:hypothetical protein